ncbi:MAG: hypothetical protein ALECFALPRED_004475 [Alectoria fallacina]|uniref:Uncharacterized protein n=1 Tax=Alectoria fallacina TaxID=1903189 RepID=A0A8H3FPL3_9LECA|nr:MAG: hypothetical protein ALECFALPRED_004475 [Alectoria fallacina]
MKPVVSALNAWSCVVVSVFAIIILSIIGGLFSANHHSMVGSTKDPADGKAVAGSVFAAVVVYAVCYTPSELLNGAWVLEDGLVQ